MVSDDNIIHHLAILCTKNFEGNDSKKHTKRLEPDFVVMKIKHRQKYIKIWLL